MNTLAGIFTRPDVRRSPPSWEGGAWLGAVAIVLGFAVVAALALPGALVLPALTLALFTTSVVPAVMARRGAMAQGERAWLFAGMLFAFGILASVLTDLDRLAAYLG